MYVMVFGGMWGCVMLEFRGNRFAINVWIFTERRLFDAEFRLSSETCTTSSTQATVKVCARFYVHIRDARGRSSVLKSLVIV